MAQLWGFEFGHPPALIESVNAINAQPVDQAGMLAAFVLGAPLFGVAPAAQPPADPGFLNILNILMTPDAASAPAENVLGDSAALVPNAPPCGTQPKIIADALIRSMLGSGSAPQTNTPRVKADEAKDSADLIASAVPQLTSMIPAAQALPAPVAPQIVPTPVGQQAGAKTTELPSPIGTPSNLIKAQPATAPAPLAFAVEITPKETPAGNPDDQPENTTDDAETPRRAAPAAGIAPAEHERPDDSGSGTDGQPTPQIATAAQVSAPVVATPTPAHNLTKTVDQPVQLSAAVAIRTSEPAVAPAPARRTEDAQEITVRIARPEAPTVDLRIAERDGQIHVAVHTPDASLQNSLRQQVGTLVEALDRAGFRAETFAPTAVSGDSSSAQMGNRDAQQPDTQPDSSGRGSRDSEGRGQQQQQRQREERPQDFKYEMENAR